MNLCSFIPWKEKSILFAWMVAPLLVVVVIFLSFKTNDYIHDIRIYNIVTTPLFGLIVGWLLHTIIKTPAQPREEGFYYSKPIAWVLRMTLWGSLAGRMAMMSFKIFCYSTHSCHHPLVASDNSWELLGGLLDDITDILVLLSLYLYVRHTLKTHFITPSYKFVFQKHLILAVLVLLFFQIAAQEVHELIEENHMIEAEEKNDTVSEYENAQESRIELAIEFVAPFTFLLSTELIGLLFGLAFVMDVRKDDHDRSTVVSPTPRFQDLGKRFSFGAVRRKSTDDEEPIVDQEEPDKAETNEPTNQRLKLQFVDEGPRKHLSRSNSLTPDFIPIAETIHEVDETEEDGPSSNQQEAKRNNIPPPINVPSHEEGAKLSASAPASAVWKGFPFHNPPKSFVESKRFSSAKRNILAKFIIFLSVTLTVAEFVEMSQKTFLYGRFELAEFTVSMHDYNITYMGPDREVADCLNIGTNFWACVLFLLMIYKVTDDIKHLDYESKKEEHHSKIDKLFLFFTVILWTIAIGIHMAANFVTVDPINPHHRYGLTTAQKWTGFFRDFTLLFEIWLQLILLQIQLSIKIPKKVHASSKLHHWTLIIVLHSVLAFDVVEWLTFFFDQQFTKHLLPFYSSSLLIVTRLLTPYIGMYLFHACCCWMIVRNNFRKRQYFEFGNPTELHRAISSAFELTANVAAIRSRSQPAE